MIHPAAGLNLQPIILEARLILNARAALGEGAIWHNKEACLYWVDIEKKCLHRFAPQLAQNEVFPLQQFVSTVVPKQSGGLLLALQDGIFDCSFSEKQLRRRAFFPDFSENLRFNDGKCDAQGRLWVGTMDLAGKTASGALYRFAANETEPLGIFSKMLGNLRIPNGIAWSADGKKMYHTDTPTQKIMGYDFDPERGEITNPTVAIEVPDEAGVPDGMSIDVEDKLWVAHWGGSAVIRWDPQTGKMMEKINVPAPQVTSCAFGDDDLRSLYITTARTGLSENAQQKFPRSGGLFKARVAVAGQPANPFRGY